MRKFLFVVIFCLTFYFANFQSYAEDSYNESGVELRASIYDGETGKPPVLSADPEQTSFSTRFLKSQTGIFSNRYYMDMSCGSYAPIFRIFDGADKASPDILSVNVKGLMKSRFGFFTKSFNLYAVDFFGGVSFAYRAPWKNNNLFELYFFHQSSHLGDDFLLDNTSNPTNYSLEVMRLLHFLNLMDNMIVAYGLQYDLRKDPSMHEGRLTIQLNWRYNFELLKQNFFVAVDFKSWESNHWSASNCWQAGWDFAPSRHPETRSIVQSLVFEYYNGFSSFGQFSQEHEKYFSLGINLNL